MEPKQSARELLQEARDALYDEMHGVHNGSFTDGLERRNRKDTLIATIDAYLAAPRESAMDIVRMPMEMLTEQDQWDRGNEGKTLRDWFAGQALKNNEQQGNMDKYEEMRMLFIEYITKVQHGMKGRKELAIIDDYERISGRDFIKDRDDFLTKEVGR